MQHLTGMKTLWELEFRHFSSWDYGTPLMYLPVQRTMLRAATEEDAKAELRTWAGPGGRVEIISCQRAPEWMQKL